MMNEVQNDVEVYATFQNILCWWFVFVLLDAAIWGGLMRLHSAYIALPHRGTFVFRELLFLPILGIIGKTMLLQSQSPCLLVFAYFYRKRLLLLKRYWFLLPTVSFFVGFGIILVPQIVGEGLHVTIRWVAEEIIDYRTWMHMLIPMSLVSTIIATIPWAIFLERRFRDLKR